MILLSVGFIGFLEGITVWIIFRIGRKDMFYEVDLPEIQSSHEMVSAMIVLNPAESRRLLAKATVACYEIQKAWAEGIIILARGITNAYVSEELFDITIENKAAQTAGLVGD